MSSAQRGQFVWHELMTTDTAGAGDFYPRIAGWKTQAWDNDNSYTMWVGDQGPLGGVMSLPQEGTTSSHWMPYISTEDVAATVAAARDLGATVCKDTTQLPNGGSYAVLQDPQGATFAVHADGPDAPPAGSSPERTDFSWHELSTGDLDAALEFYTELFGWGPAEKHDMGELGFYQLFSRNGLNIGGMYVGHPGMSPHWLSYVRVTSVDDAANAAKAAGGRVVNGPMEVPGGDWIAQLVDPQGAAFAVHELKSAAKPARAVAKPKAPKAKRAEAKPTEVAAAPAAVERATKPAAKAAKKSATKSATKSASAVAKTPRKAPTAKSGARPTKVKAKAKARRAPARARAGAKAKASRRRASARAAAAAKSKRSARRAPAKRASSARRRPAARKKAVRRTARRVVRAKRRR